MGIADQCSLEPGQKVLCTHVAGRDCDDEIVNGFVVGYIKMVTASLDQEFHEYPGGSLVAIDEPVVSDHAMHERRGFFCERSVVPEVRSGKRGFDQMKTGNPRSTPKAERHLMRAQGIGQCHPVVCPSD